MILACNEEESIVYGEKNGNKNNEKKKSLTQTLTSYKNNEQVQEREKKR